MERETILINKNNEKEIQKVYDQNWNSILKMTDEERLLVSIFDVIPELEINKKIKEEEKDELRKIFKRR